MREHLSRIARRVLFGTLWLAVLAVVSITAWCLRPLAREYSIREAMSRPSPPSWWPAAWRQELKVRQKLRQPVSLEFVETPLSDVLDFLRDFTDLEVRVDELSLTQANASTDVPVSVYIGAYTLRSALRVILDQQDLSYLIEDGTLVITTKTAARARLTTQTSPATPLVGVPWLRDSNHERRSEAAFAMAHTTTTSRTAVVLLIEALKDRDKQVRFDAAYALGEAGGAASDAVQSLSDLRRDDEKAIDRVALSSLVKIGDSSLQLLLSAMEDSDRLTAISVANAVTELGTRAPEEVISYLIEVLDSESVFHRMLAAQTLGQLGQRSKVPMPVLILALDESDHQTRSMAIGLFVKIDHPGDRSIPALIEALHDDKPAVRSGAALALRPFGLVAANAVPAIIEAMHDKNVEVRRAATRTLVDLSPWIDTTLPLLLNAIHDDDGHVRAGAIQSIGKFGHAAHEAVPELIESMLHDREWFVRVDSAKALGEIGPAARAAVPALINSGHPNVRDVVPEVLKKIDPSALNRL